MTTDPQPTTSGTTAAPAAAAKPPSLDVPDTPTHTRDTAYLAALTTYTRSLTSASPATDNAPPSVATLLSLAAQAGYPSATADADLAADLSQVASQSPTPDVLDATYQLAFTPGMPATAHPGLMYLLLTLGFQVDDYATVLGSYCVDVKYRGLVKQVVGEIKDAPAATALLGGYREQPAAAEDKEEEEEAHAGQDKDEGAEEEQGKVHEHDRLYHVEMDVSEEVWRWSWDRVKQIPGLATFMQV
ncbi:hypothetical protein BCR44DRAFT_34870 [Catenaria anguillulae PL171]|uniref:Uncharacterized protein n=1 Tax=Catenaria anguillulae PL171 TaxID=765915 RepID=A0A1Y2HCM0_9FUNG|nr:hypothetical protein BCR44DRAFT_34870 [Catenaria anguillulae PL171]